MPITTRPRNLPEAPGYMPSRDVAYIYKSMCGQAFAYLEETHWKSWFGDYMRHTGMSEEDLGQGCACLAAAINLFTGHPEIEGPDQALEEAGFFELPMPTQLAIYGTLGMVLTGTFFMAIRDETMAGEAPPDSVGVDDILAGGQEVLLRYQRNNLWTRLKAWARSLGRPGPIRLQNDKES